MDPPLLQAVEPLSMTLLFFIIPLLFLLGLVSHLRQKLPYPPGPKGLPLIGNMLIMMNQLSHRDLAELAKRYGGLLHLRMGLSHLVCISTPDMARQVLRVQDTIFSNRPVTIAIRYLTYDRSNLVFANCSPYWRQMRKLCATKLFSRKRAKSCQSVRDEVEFTIRAVAASTSSSTGVNISELASALMISITYRAAFGSSSREGMEEFVSIMNEHSKLFRAFNIADFMPWLKWVDPQGFTARLVKARASVDRFIDKIIDDHIKKKQMMGNHGSPNEVVETDMVDDLLAFYSEEARVVVESEDLENSIKITRNNIKAIIMDTMVGGTEPPASVIEWTMAELIKNPEDLKKVQQELADVVGLKRRVEESDFEKLTYLKCILKETLRLHSPIPLLLHETNKDTLVAGYHIPAKSRVLINAWAIGRDKDSWEDPDTFKPSRFLKEGVPDYKGNNFEFIPFGSGQRSCPGMQLGLYAVELSVAHLLHCFTWELPDGMCTSKLDMNDVFGFTIGRQTPLLAIPTPRLLCPLY